MLDVLVRRETGDGAVARRSLWVLSLLPAAFVLVMGYAESVLLVFALGCFLALRPPAGASGLRPHFAVAGVLAFAAALTRPIGVLLVLATMAELSALVASARSCGARGGHRRRRGAFCRPADIPGLVQAHGRRLAGSTACPAAELAPRWAVGPLHHAVPRRHGGAAPSRRHGSPRAMGAAGARDAHRLLAAAPRALHVVRCRRPGHRRGRVQPRLVRALCAERLPAFDRRRGWCSRSRSSSAPSWRSWRPGWPATRSSPSSTSRSPDRCRRGSPTPVGAATPLPGSTRGVH